MGEFLKELHLTEGRNTGIHKMLRSLSENGSPQPLLETDEERLYFLTTIYARNPGNEGAPAEPKTSKKASVRREQVLAYLSEHPSSTLSGASVELGVGMSTLNRDVAELKAEEKLRREGPNKGGMWVAL